MRASTSTGESNLLSITRLLGRMLIAKPLELTIPSHHRLRLGRHIADRANGDSNEDMRTNREQMVSDCVKSSIKAEPTTIFDVGANVGEWTRDFGGSLGPNVSIHSFEPSRATYGQLVHQITASQPRFRWVPVNMAVSDTDGEAQLHVTEPLAGSNSLFARDAPAVQIVTKEIETVRVCTLDSYCEQQGIRSLRFLKIDVEGNEMAVLRGASSLLENNRIDMLQFEYSYAWIDARAFLKDAFALLEPKGYRLGKIHSNGIRWHPRYSELQETFRFSNYLAVHPEFMSLFPIVH